MPDASCKIQVYLSSEITKLLMFRGVKTRTCKNENLNLFGFMTGSSP